MERRRLPVAFITRRLPPEAIDCPVPRRRDDPAGGARRDALARPSLECDRERILDRLFGKVDVAELPDEDGHGAAVLVAERAIDVHQC
jgi:hypothetical protein